jgi:hypothetical protein
MTWGFVLAALGLYFLIGALGYFKILPHSVYLVWRDLFLHFFKRPICLVRRRHVRSGVAGILAPKGFRGVPLHQCTFCGEFWLTNADAKRLGGK